MFEYIIGLLAFLRAFHHFRIFRIKRKNFENVPIMKGGNPFFYKRGKIGILLIHGFTRTPQEMRGLGRYLAKKDITVYCPLLKHHGTVVEELIKGKLPEWNNQIIQEIEFLKGHCDKIYIGGNSFGGNLALIYAASHKVEGIISFGTPIFWKRERFHKSLYYIARQFKIFQHKIYWYKKQGINKEMMKTKIHYAKIPLPTVSQVIQSAALTKKVLKEIKAPILIIQSANDAMVDKRTPGYIYDQVNAIKKKLVWINDSYHVVLIDKNKKKVFEESYHFILETLNLEKSKDLNRSLI